jgi:hypothetical protein
MAKRPRDRLKAIPRWNPKPPHKIYPSHITEAAEENLRDLMIKHGLIKPDNDKRGW